MKKQILILGIILLMIMPIIAEQITWDNDSDILIKDSWYDIDGLPLDGATCSWQLYNPNLSLNQSGVPTLINGRMNFTISKLPTIQIYPILINCSRGGYNGTSSKDSLKIVDELTEDFKDNLEEINQTTHMTYDLLSGQINNTLNSILTITNFTKNNLTDIHNQLTSILNNQNTLIEKWGSEDANEIIDEIKDLDNLIRNLEFRIGFISEEEQVKQESRLKTLATTIVDDVNGKQINWQRIRVWGIPIGCSILAIFIILLIINSVQKRKMGFPLPKS